MIRIKRNHIMLAILLLAIARGHAVWNDNNHNGGILQLNISNYGRFGYQNAGIWPKGSGESYIFGAGIWVGAVKGEPADTTSLTADIEDTSTVIPVSSAALMDTNGGLVLIGLELVHYKSKTSVSLTGCLRGFAQTAPAPHLLGAIAAKKVPVVTMGYDCSSGNSSFVPGDLPNEAGYTNPDERVLLSDVPGDSALWPIRDPQNSRQVRSSQDSYSIFNDLDNGASGIPADIKVEQIGYSWSYQFYEDFVFLTYRIINQSPDSLTSVYLGLGCDADLGGAEDDLITFDPLRNLGIAYDSDSLEWGHRCGEMGFDFLESPLDSTGSQLGLTAFKITRNPGVAGQGEPDPSNDDQAYQLLAGYNYSSGSYHPFDTISTATDVRFLQCTGPFKLAGFDTAQVVVAVIAGADRADLQHNSDLAQNLYDIGFITDYVRVTAPNGGEELSGTANITWEDSSAIGGTLKVSISYSRDGGRTYNYLVTDTTDNNSYQLNTNDLPDGTLYKLRVTVHDSICVGEDVSDSLFTINNPGVNGVPDVILAGPKSGSLTGTVPVSWMAADADGDTLRIAIYIRQIGQTSWIPLDTNQANDGIYPWNTYQICNGDYQVKVTAFDAISQASDSTVTYVSIVNDHHIAADISHQGGCDMLSVQALSYRPDLYTGHTYQMIFQQIQRVAGENQPRYSYDLWDSTLASIVLDNQELSTRYDGGLYVDNSPVIDGFGLELTSQVEPANFLFTSFAESTNASGYNGKLTIFNQNSQGMAPPLAVANWAWRGSDYAVYWVKHSVDTTKLTLQIRDLTNDVDVPWGAQIGDFWHFGITTDSASMYSAAKKGFYLCGGYFLFNQSGTMTVPPGVGDIWKITSTGYKTPCPGNIYAWRTTATGVESGAADQAVPGLIFENSPNPFSSSTAFRYSISGSSQPVTLRIYNIAGQRVKELVKGMMTPGVHTVRWSGQDDNGVKVSSGVYFCRMNIGGKYSVKKITLLR